LGRHGLDPSVRYPGDLSVSYKHAGWRGPVLGGTYMPKATIDKLDQILPGKVRSPEWLPTEVRLLDVGR
jgi:hypothetical protein